jgi:hypothetical protein
MGGVFGRENFCDAKKSKTTATNERERLKIERNDKKWQKTLIRN